MQKMTGPQSENDSLGILVPAFASGMENAKFHQALDEILEREILLFLDIDGLDILANALQDGVHAVGHLTFDHPHHGIVTQTHVGTQQVEQVGEIRDGHAEISVRRLPPDLAQNPAVLAHHFDVGGAGE